MRYEEYSGIAGAGGGGSHLLAVDAAAEEARHDLRGRRERRGFESCDYKTIKIISFITQDEGQARILTPSKGSRRDQRPKRFPPRTSHSEEQAGETVKGEAAGRARGGGQRARDLT